MKPTGPQACDCARRHRLRGRTVTASATSRRCPTRSTWPPTPAAYPCPFIPGQSPTIRSWYYCLGGSSPCGPVALGIRSRLVHRSRCDRSVATTARPLFSYIHRAANERPRPGCAWRASSSLRRRSLRADASEAVARANRQPASVRTQVVLAVTREQGRQSRADCLHVASHIRFSHASDRGP
jgi:hypothetical protein